MIRRASLSVSLVLVLTVLVTGTAWCNFPDSYHSTATAENCGKITIAPGGGDTLADDGNTIHLYVHDIYDVPISGIPATDMWLDNEDVYFCEGLVNQADGPTDANGHTSFSGTFYAGLLGDASSGINCDETWLSVFVMGIIINCGNPVCVSVDSPDVDGSLTVTVGDFAAFAHDYNCTADCDPCHDYNNSGDTDLMDLAIFAGYFHNSTCP